MQVFPSPKSWQEQASPGSRNTFSVIQHWLDPFNDQSNKEDLEAVLNEYHGSEEVLLAAYRDLIWAHMQAKVLPVLTDSSQDHIEGPATQNIGLLTRIISCLQQNMALYRRPTEVIHFSATAVASLMRLIETVCIKHTPKHVYDRLEALVVVSFDMPAPQPAVGLCKQFSLVGYGTQMHELLGRAVKRAVQQRVQRYSKDWDTALEPVEAWVRSQVAPVAVQMVPEPASAAQYSQFLDQLVELVGQEVCQVRTSALFDMMVAFPDSIPAIQDLAKTLKQPRQRQRVVAEFVRACDRRLLHCGATTSDLVNAYISTMRTFHELEPKGVLLDAVARPLRKYIKDRDDSVAVIVAGLLGHQGSELTELREILTTRQDVIESSGADDFGFNLQWTPDPVDTPSDFAKARPYDIVGSLLSLYDPAVFAHQLSSVLAEILLKDPSAVDDMVLVLECLKLKFADNELQSLNVMIRDLSQSQRLDPLVRSVARSRGQPLFKRFHANVLSRLYWPAFKDSALVLPPLIEKQMQSFGRSFEHLKRDRKLKWLRHVGLVKLDLEFEDRVVEFSVTPIQAAAIAYFQDGPRTTQQVTGALKLSEVELVQVLGFWMSKGVLAFDEAADSYRVLERLGDATNVDQAQQTEDQAEETDSAQEVYWTYVEGMLTNLGTQQLERIQSFLAMVVPPSQAKTASQLQSYMDAWVQAGKLRVVEGGYAL